MRQKASQAATVWHSIIILILVLCGVLIGATPALALSIDDFFSYTYTAQFSKTEIREGEAFSVTVVGRATCNVNLPLPASEATVIGRITAVHTTSSANVTLNPSYTVTIAPVPSQKGETGEATRVVSLQFPAGSPFGTYRVVGETIEGKVKVPIFGWIDVTRHLPASRTVGSVTYGAVSPPPPPPPSSGGGGGGGGGGPQLPQPSLTPGTTNVAGAVGANGIFDAAVVAQSADKKCKLTIDTGTKGLTQEGASLTKLVITEVKTPPTPPENSNTVGLTYDLGPDGATFEPPISLALTYEPDNVPQGVNEKNLAIATWDVKAAVWVKLESTVDPAAHTVSAPIRHFTNFTILTYTRPAAFTVSDLTITPAEVGIKEEVTIKVVVANTGDLSGSYKVTLKVDNAVVATKEVTLAGGAKQPVTFATTKDADGRYSVTIDSLSGAFVVKAPPSPAPPTPSMPPPPSVPATFTTSELSITPAEVNIGEAVTISVLVANTGDLSGSYKVTLKVDNAVVATKEVTLTGGAKQQVTFTTTKDAAGRYSVTIDRLSGAFVVKAPLSLPDDWWLIGSTIAAAIIDNWLIGSIIAAAIISIIVIWRLATPRQVRW